MPQSKAILVIDPVSSGSLYRSALAGADCEVVFLDTERAAVAGLRHGPTEGALSFEKDLDASRDALVDLCREKQVGYVVIGSESGVELAEYVRESLDGCPRNDPDRPWRRSRKDAMFAALAEHGVPTLHTTAVTHSSEISPADYNRLDAEGGLVVKPSVGAGSVDVRMVSSTAELEDAVAGILNSPGFFGDHPSALIQQLYPNPRTEYVVDTFSHDGVHEVIAVSVYDKTLSPTGDFVYERIRWVDADDPICAGLASYARSVLDAFGMRIGPAHIEVMHGPELGFRLVDFGARSHGAGHPARTHYLTGTSQVHRESEYALHAVTGAGAFAAKQLDYSLPRRGAVVFFSCATRSRCVRRPAPAALSAVAGVVDVSIHAQEGRTYEPTRSLMDSEELGLAFVVADNDEELDRRCAGVRAEFARYFTDD